MCRRSILASELGRVTSDLPLGMDLQPNARAGAASVRDDLTRENIMRQAVSLKDFAILPCCPGA